MKKYIIKAPNGVHLAPEGQIDERQVREFAMQINQNEENRETWVEKIEKDDIAEVVDWLKSNGYEVEEHGEDGKE